MPVGEELAKARRGQQGCGWEGRAAFVVPIHKIYVQYPSGVKSPYVVGLPANLHKIICGRARALAFSNEHHLWMLCNCKVGFYPRANNNFKKT